VSYQRVVSALSIGLLLVGSGCSVLFDPEEAMGDESDASDRSDEPAPDAAPSQDCTTTTISVVNAENDGEVYDTFWMPDGEYNDGKEQGIAMGTWGGLPVWGYYRFALPPDLVIGDIDFAYLGLWGRDILEWDSASNALRISLEDTPESLVIGSPKQAPGQSAQTPMVNATARWPESGGLDWLDEEYNVSSDVSELLHSLSDPSVPASGGHITFWVRGEPSIENRNVITDDLALYDLYPAQLRLRSCTERR
jgi:hypothetical protein